MGSSCSASQSSETQTTEFELNVENQKVRARARRIPHAMQDVASTAGSDPSPVSTMLKADSSVFVLLERCSGVPASQSSSLSCACGEPSLGRNRPYVKAYVKSSSGEPLGDAVQWPERSNTRSPAWFSARPLGVGLVEDPQAMLHIELWDGQKKVGALDARLGSLPGHHDETCEFRMEPGMETSGPCTVTFQILDSAALSFGARTVYFVRHGESIWNAAQSGGRLHEMAAEFDHPLSAKGARQAEALRQRIELGLKACDNAAMEVSSPGVLYVSPLCRAVQTGLIALGPSQAAHHAEFVVMAAAREKQNFGGLDTMSNRKGAGILHGTVDGLKRLYKDRPDRLREVVENFKQLKFDVHEAEEQWWCEGTSDSSSQLHLRIQEFMAQILYTPHETAVVVGHSHFFRSVFKSCLSEECKAAKPKLADDLCSKKLMNCGVVKVSLDPRRGIERFPIMDVELVLGTTLDADHGSLACCAAPAHADDNDSINTLVIPDKP